MRWSLFTFSHYKCFYIFMQVRLHMMCADHPNIVQILEVYANSVQFPHESSPRCVSCEILSTVWRFLLCPPFHPINDLSFQQSEAPDRHGDDGGRRAVPQNQSAQTLYRKDGKPGYKTGKATWLFEDEFHVNMHPQAGFFNKISLDRSVKLWNIVIAWILHIVTWSQRICSSRTTRWWAS